MVTTGIVFLPLAIICGASTQPTDMLEVRLHRLSLILCNDIKGY